MYVCRFVHGSCVQDMNFIFDYSMCNVPEVSLGSSCLKFVREVAVHPRSWISSVCVCLVVLVSKVLRYLSVSVYPLEFPPSLRQVSVVPSSCFADYIGWIDSTDSTDSLSGKIVDCRSVWQVVVQLAAGQQVL